MTWLRAPLRLRRSATIAAGVLAALTLGWGQAAASTADTVEVRRTVTVTDVPTGASLDPKSLVVTVDGQPVEAEAELLGETVAKPSQTVDRSVILAIDTSGSMVGEGIVLARRAARSFVAAVPDDVAIGLLTFDDRVNLLSEPTQARTFVQKSIDGIRASSGNTSLYDAMQRGLAALGSSGERTLIVLSDGDDTASTITRSQARSSLRGSDVTVRFVAFRTSGSTTDSLQQLALRPHDVIPAGNGGQLAQAFASVADSFDTRLAVTARVPRDLDASPHVMTVRARVGDLDVEEDFRLVGSEHPDVGGSDSETGGAEALTPDIRADDPAFLTAALAVIFAAIFALVLGALVPIRASSSARLAQGLEMYSLSGARRTSSVVDDERKPSAIAGSVLELSNRVVEKRGRRVQTALRLDRAQVPLRPNEWIVMQGAAVLVWAALLLVALPPLLAIILGALLGVLSTNAYLNIKATRRMKAFSDGLPDTLQLIAGSLQTGFSLPQALDSVMHDGREPMSHELGRALAEARLGANLEDALDGIADRMDSQDFRWTVMAIRIQRQVGGNLSEVLTTTVRTMRDRAALRRQVRTLSAEGRLSAYILIALPIALLAWLTMTRYDYVSLLWTDSLGWIMSAVGGVGMVIGWFWMRKTVQVEA